ncbi:MAG: hypothetical protein AYK23_00570 [Candidatus Proteinoplasmatales archaeon SG8-5]|jgi:hypothetical protein|nr:MAG: hypothetical protein AYK23_00570 [Candidatus Proteinoplasmatales archaeon SG8-5]
MLDVALVSLIQDMSEKAGVEGTIQYWARVGESLAKRMGKEAYMGWPSFNVALREGRTAFSIEGSVTALTDLAITDVDGDVVGYIYALETCVFNPTIVRIRYSVGELPRADSAVAEEYNNSVRDTAVCNFCVIHQRFREEVAKNISIADQALDCVQLANRGFTGDTKIAEDALKKIGINPEYVRSLLRNYACVYAILMRGARLKGEEEEAE